MAVSVVAANVQTITGLLADVAESRPDPKHAVLHPRNQYNALPILRELSENIPRADTLRLGLINGDLCLPILSYVFGEAQVGGRAAVVSLHRLRRGESGRPVQTDIFLNRLAKVAVHETAHVLGLKHCRDTHCLMAFSLGLKELDALELRFCRECEAEILYRRDS